MSSVWVNRWFCPCGQGEAHYTSFNNPWFFQDELCPSCGAGLRHAAKGRRVRWRGPSLGIFRPARRGFWEIHPDDDPLPFDTKGFVRHASEAAP